MATPFTFDALVTGDTVALDASAGTGKTHTLTAIALRLIAEGKVTIEQLLIVTFTNAATAELKLRLASTLKAALGQLAGNQNGLDGTTAMWLTSGDADTINVRKNRIQAAIMAFDDASIVTIHGFCQRMLTFVGVTAGLPLDAAVTDDDTIARDLFDEFSSCFNEADTVMITPVYTAGEEPIEGITSETLVARIRAGGHRDARFIAGPEAIAPAVRDLARDGDFVVFLGAGNITQWAYQLPRNLEAGT
jgi:hypothetical protein